MCGVLRCHNRSIHHPLAKVKCAWAERAQSAGMPERFSQLALGHASKAVHRAYARLGRAVCPSLEAFERKEEPNSVAFTAPHMQQQHTAAVTPGLRPEESQAVGSQRHEAFATDVTFPR